MTTRSIKFRVLKHFSREGERFDERANAKRQ